MNINRMGCPAPRHGEYWMRSQLGCVCFDTQVAQASYARDLRAGVHRRVSALAASRIMQGLSRHGFTTAEIAAMTGLSRKTVKDVRAGRQTAVHRDTEARLRAVADRVRLDVARTGEAASRARSLARRNGWAPLPAWDPEDLDDPAASPRLGLDGDDDIDPVLVERVLAGERLRLNRAERLAAVRVLAPTGEGVNRVAELLHVSFTTARELINAVADEPELIAS